MESPMQTPADRIAKRLSAEDLRTRFSATVVPLAKPARLYTPKSATPPADRIAVRA
jgi:hypothetical protein